MKHWTLEQIPWNQFDPARVDPEFVKLVKAAAMVEFNGGDYATYLNRVFADDPEFQAVAAEWAQEEVQHGQALARWAKLADPSFDFATAFKRFTDGYSIDIDAEESVRGSRAGELVARCIVETGTSSYYAALREATDEPVLKEICRNIAADELRHYKLFYSNLRRYLDREGLNGWRRLKVTLQRLGESEDDELAYAYFAANHPDEKYDRSRFARAYARRAYAVYRRHHVERGIAMALKASGLAPTGRLNRWLTTLACWFMQVRLRRLEAINA
ncbi:ferritin-like domain-containing protein [Dongia deserti]|uniref:ferritin-like domain-containing protein n=1 Tax=Dongia deserti TaxID=2268030 RepID=UPI000E64ABD9|nr:ferritin-like domain-containing protein [Dongia deserti]